MKNDYFTRPIQSDRMRHDYGHTGLTPKQARTELLHGLWIVPLVLVVFALLWGIAP